MQTVMAPLLVALFLGSLFSLYCRHCLTQLAQARQAMAAAEHPGGHCPQHGGQPLPVPPAQPCQGVCDCGEHAMLTADHPTAVSDYRGGWESRIPIPAPDYLADYAPANPAYVIGKPDKPERACFAPLERNCVLLN